jgi:hypothetical protein
MTVHGFRQALQRSPHARCRELDDLCPDCRAAVERWAPKFEQMVQQLRTCIAHLAPWGASIIANLERLRQEQDAWHSRYGVHLEALVCFGALLTVDRPPAERDRALALLVEYVRRYARLPADWGDDGVRVSTAILLAAGEAQQRRRIRLGRQWVTDEQGQIRPVHPVELPLGDFLRWFLRAILQALEADMTGGPFVSGERDLTNLPAEQRREMWMAKILEDLDLLRHLEARLSVQDQTLLRLLLDQASPTEIQQAMGLTPVNYRQRLHRLHVRVDALRLAS